MNQRPRAARRDALAPSPRTQRRLALVDGIQHPDLLTQTARRRLYVLQMTLARCTCRIVQQDDRRGIWSELLQETEPLRPDIRPACSPRLRYLLADSGSRPVQPS